MNWKLILQLSLFGVVMAFATVFWIPTNIEPVLWLIIFGICAYFIAKRTPGKHFLHGFFVSLVNCVWITAAHVGFYDVYMANHPEMAEMSAKMPLPDHPRLMMALTGPVLGVISGLVLGLFSLLAGKLMRKSV